MDKETWMALSDELEPILRALKQIAVNYRLGEDPLSIAVFAEGNTWATFIGEGEQYDVNLDSRGTLSMTEQEVVNYVRS